MSATATAPAIDSAPIDDTISEKARTLARGFALTTALTYGLIVLGALVRANHAGLSCPDWPLCFGQLIPQFDMRVAFEWGHRAIAGGIAIVFGVLGVLTLRVPALRARVGLGYAIAAALLVAQIVLGGLTVLQLLAYWTVTAHLLTGNAFALALAFITASLFEAAREARAAGTEDEAPRPMLPALKGLVFAAAFMLFVQMLLGGLVSSQYAGLLCDEWPTCTDGVWVPSLEGGQGLHLLHRFNAYALFLALFGLQLACQVDPTEHGSRLSTLVRAIFLVCLLQIGVGVANVLLRLQVEVTGLHSALAAVLVLLTGLSVREALRRPTLVIERVRFGE